MPKSKQAILPAVQDMRNAALIIQRLVSKYGERPQLLQMVADELRRAAEAELSARYREEVDRLMAGKTVGLQSGAIIAKQIEQERGLPEGSVPFLGKGHAE